MTNEMRVIETDTIMTADGPVEVQMFKSHAVAFVRSSKPNHFYRVSITRDFARCECKAASFGRPCRHVKLITQALKGGAS